MAAERPRRFTETGITRALDPGGGLGFFQRFQYRVLAVLLALSFASSVVAGLIFYSRQVKFVEAEQQRRGSLLISNLAGQSELGAYSGDHNFLFGPVRRTFEEPDVLYVTIYGRGGRSLIAMKKTDFQGELTLPRKTYETLAAKHSSAPSQVGHASYDDLIAPIVSVRDDPEDGLFSTLSASAQGSVTIGLARLGLSRMPAQQKLDEVLRWGIYLALIVLAMGTIFALVLARRLSRPIMSLARGADELRRGNLGFQLEITRSDELGLLAESFNRMSAKLSQTVESLAHLNRHLEQEVGRRTSELQRSRDFAVLLNAPLQLDNLLDTALDALVRDTRALAGAVLLNRASGLELAISNNAHRTAFFAADGTQGFPEFIVEPLSAKRIWVVKSFPAEFPLKKQYPEMRALLSVPVHHRDEVLAGLLLAYNQAPSDDLIGFVQHAASELSIAVANAKTLAAAERLARELEQQNVGLLEQRDRLQTLNRLKSEFLANVSHEVRTPLNAVLGYAELLGEGVYGPVTAEQSQSIVGISENAKNLLELINQILDLSKVEAGEMRVELREVDVKQLVLDVVEYLSPLVKDRPYVLSAELPNDPLQVHSDEVILRQILVNLVSNAVKFTPKGAVTILAWVSDDDAIHIEVRDTGIGIRKEHLAFIFDEFRQVDGSSTRAHGGTGLGLAISKKFAILLGADIEVASTFGEGSRFTVVLPRVRLLLRADESILPERAIIWGDKKDVKRT